MVGTALFLSPEPLSYLTKFSSLTTNNQTPISKRVIRSSFILLKGKVHPSALMCPFLPITTSVMLLITKINQYRLKSASNLIHWARLLPFNSKLRNRRLLAVYYAVNWLGLFSFISFIALNTTLLHWLSFSIYVAVRLDSAEDLFIIYY